MISVLDKKMYSEVYGVLNLLGDKYKKRIPHKLYELIYNNRLEEYNPVYSMNIPLSEQNISKRAVSFICMIHYRYWCVSDKEKEMINSVLLDNKKKQQEKYFNYFSKGKEQSVNLDKTKEDNRSDKNNQQLMVISDAHKWYRKIYYKILNVLKIKRK